MSGARPVSIYDRMCWPQAELERALALGAHRRELSAYLGESEYRLLRALARQALRAQQRPRRRAAAAPPKIWLLPGILGSQLGRNRGPGQPPDLLWLDPDDIVLGRLTELAQHDGQIVALGCIVYSYLALKLRLVAAGFEVTLFDYDWRADLLSQGAALAARLQADEAARVVLIAHSMGGLLVRAALAHLRGSAADARVQQVINLGVPQAGAMAAVQALRGTYPVVGRLAAMDRIHDAATLTASTFRTFASVYQLLPHAEPALDLFDPGLWPGDPAPDLRLLRAARRFSEQLAPADTRFVSIIGQGQRTVTAVQRYRDQFRYQISSAGDGTVATASARLAQLPCYSLRCEHSALPRQPLIAAALIDLVRSGRTRRLPSGARIRHGHIVSVTDATLRRALARKMDWHALGSEARRLYLNRLNEPPPAYRNVRR